jgi:hypothetical protein
MINGNIDEIIEITDELNVLLGEYLCDAEQGMIVVDLDAWATCDLLAAQDIFMTALELRADNG